MSENAPGSTVPADSVAGIRCSDAEREQARASLCTAAGEGRLTMDEVDERLRRLEEVRFRHELAAVTADLPATEAKDVEGWQAITIAAGRALAADLSVLLGRAPEPAPGRRRVLVGIAVLLGLLAAAALVIGAVHGFGADGFESHGMDAVEHGHG